MSKLQVTRAATLSVTSVSRMRLAIPVKVVRDEAGEHVVLPWRVKTTAYELKDLLGMDGAPFQSQALWSEYYRIQDAARKKRVRAKNKRKTSR